MRLICLLTASLSVLTQAQLPDWPVAVGGNPARSGRSLQTGPNQPNLLWSGGMSAVVAQQGAIEGNRFFVARMFDIGDVQQGTLILAYDLATGAEIWRKSLPVDFPATDWRNMMTGVRNGVVYATRAGNTNSSYLYALDASNGNTVWRSQNTVDQSTTESVTFTGSGDLVIGNFGNVRLVRALDGTTVWTRNRSAPSSDGSSVAVFGNHGYTWEAGSSGPTVDVIDLTTGTLLYKSAGIGGGFVQQLGLMVGPDGTVYAPRTQNNTLTDFFVAYTDTGSGLVEKWRYPMGYCPFASHAVGPDGSVYTYARTTPPTVVRLDPVSGAVIDNSPPLPSDFFQPRIALDAAGKVFLTNGGFSQGALFAMNANLTHRWSVNIPNVNLGGPVLGAAGTLIVCGTGSNIRAYRDPGDTLPNDYTIFRGLYESGNLQSLWNSEDDRLVVKNGFVANVNEPPIAINVFGVAPLQTPANYQIRAEARVSTVGLTQEILAFNWNTQSFDLLDSRSGSLADQTVTANVPTNGNYVQAGTRLIRARIQYRRTGPVQSNSWFAGIDQFTWTIN